MSDNAAPILSRSEFDDKWSIIINPSGSPTERYNAAVDIDRHNAAQREEIQRLAEELSERSSYIANYEHATQIERAELDAELSALRAELEAVKVAKGKE